MSLSDVKDWAWLASPVITLVIVPAVMWWLSKQFPSRIEVARDIDGLKGRVAKTEERLDSGERRFVSIETLIREATHAADEAKRAADRATTAADKIADMRVSLAELGGELKMVTALLQRVEKNAGLLLEGHLDTAG